MTYTGQKSAKLPAGFSKHYHLGVPGGRLWIEEAGQGPPVVLVHAAIADRRMWDGQLAALVDRYRVIRYDQRGFGRSDSPAEPYSPVADLGAVLDHTRVGRAVLVGCSVGGAIALEYVLTHPGRIAALVPVASALADFAGSAACGQAAYGTADGQEQAALQRWAPLRTDPEVDGFIRQLLIENLSGLAALGLMEWASAGAEERLISIDAPALVVVGDRDQQDVIHTARLLADELPRAGLAVLPGVDHNVPVRAEAAFTRLLVDFLDGLDRRPAGRTTLPSSWRTEASRCLSFTNWA